MVARYIGKEVIDVSLGNAPAYGATPFLTMSFLALSVIPALKITDRGLVDVERFELVPLSVE